MACLLSTSELDLCKAKGYLLAILCHLVPESYHKQVAAGWGVAAL